ncbi:MAG: hypothetical protein ACXIUW_11875 [Roseinatronobacter sp.]
MWLLLAVPAYGQAAPDLQDLDPDAVPAAPETNSAMDLTLPEIFTSGEPDREVNGCVVPGRPDWLLAVSAEDHVARMVVNAIGRANWKRKVSETQDCSCENRWPDWPAVIAEFQEKYAGLDRSALSAVEAEYRTIMRREANSARSICREQGR